MSPKSRGRATKKSSKPRTTRSGPPESPAAGLVRQVGRKLRRADALAAELLVSWLLHDLPNDIAVAAAPFPDPPFDALVLDLLGEIADIGSPDALGLLQCVAVLGTPAQRTFAAHAAQRLTAAGTTPPPWTRDLTAVVPVRAWQNRDVFDDLATIAVEFDRAGNRHALVVQIDRVAGGTVDDAFVTDDPDALRADIEAELEEPLEVIEELELGAAQALLAAAIAATHPDPLVEVDDDEYEGILALVRARLRILPPGEPPPLPEPLAGPERDRVIAAFLDAPEAAGLRERPGAERCARRVVADTGVRFPDGRIGTSPGRFMTLLPAGLCDLGLGDLGLGDLGLGDLGLGDDVDRDDEDELDDEQAAVLTDVTVAWARFAGREMALPAEALEELVGAAGTVDPAAVEEMVTSYLGDLLADDDVDPGDLPEAAVRRAFAMPLRSARIRGEEFTSLDPRDPDERHLLITAEHPEYQEALDDPFPETVGDVNPRLHIAVHEIVANQLWDDDPPEAWRAARRLLATGMDRHDVLHELGAVVTEHLWHALAGELPADVAAYRRALDALGAPPQRRH